MKFLSLALALLLAVGTQDRTLQADAFTFHISITDILLDMLKEVKMFTQRGLNHLDDTEYEMYKDELNLLLDGLQFYVDRTSRSLAPSIDPYFNQLLDAVHRGGNFMDADVRQLLDQLAPKNAELRAILDKQLKEYNTKLKSLIEEYADRENMDALKAKMDSIKDSIIEEMRTRVSANVEETRSLLGPMVETIREKLAERLVELVYRLVSYAEANGEQIIHMLGTAGKMAGFLRGNLEEKAERLKENVGPAAEEATAQLMALYKSISEAIKE